MFGKNALIVDDSSTARAVLKHQLSQYDIVVELACDGNHALNLLRDHIPDVIFLDHVMPGLDGFQVLAALKQNLATRDIPVVMYTSQAAPQYIREAKSRGAIAIIPKDVTGDQLADTLNKVELHHLRAANDDMGAAMRCAEPGDHRPAGAANARSVGDRTGAVPQIQVVKPPRIAIGSIGHTSAEPPHRIVEPGISGAAAARTGGNRMVQLLLAALLATQSHALWRDREQLQTIDELRARVLEQARRLPEFQAQIELQQQQLNESSAWQMELLMNALMERVDSNGADVPAREPPEAAAEPFITE